MSYINVLKWNSETHNLCKQWYSYEKTTQSTHCKVCKYEGSPVMKLGSPCKRQQLTWVAAGCLPFIKENILNCMFNWTASSFRFEEKIFTNGQKPPLICGSCQKEGHCKADCREDELPPLVRLPPMNNHFINQLTAIFEQLTSMFCCSHVISEIRIFSSGTYLLLLVFALFTKWALLVLVCSAYHVLSWFLCSWCHIDRKILPMIISPLLPSHL